MNWLMMASAAAAAGVALVVGGWLLRGGEVWRMEKYQLRDEEHWRESLIAAQERYVALMEEFSALLRENRELRKEGRVESQAAAGVKAVA
jgi:hypothetical protein